MNSSEAQGHEGHRERLRKRFLAFGDQMSEQELLELILTFSIPRKDVALLAADLLKQYQSMAAILAAPAAELASFQGIGESSVVLLKMMDILQMKMRVHQQPALFDIHEDPQRGPDLSARTLRVFANDEIANSLQFLPQAPLFSQLEEFKTYLVKNLPYNSEETRRRRANYILDRFYPSARLATPLTFFLQNTLRINQQPREEVLKPVVFYHILKSEPIAVKVAEELIYPLLPVGRTQRDTLKEFVVKYLPEASASSLKNMLRAIFYAYSLLGVGSVSGESLRFQLHPGDFEAFLYIFSCEFPQPGIYSFEQLYQGPLHRWLLWDRDWIRRQLYNLRDLGIVAKISEIDTVKQFTVGLDQSEALHEYFRILREKPFFLRERPEGGFEPQAGVEKQNLSDHSE